MIHNKFAIKIFPLCIIKNVAKFESFSPIIQIMPASSALVRVVRYICYTVET